MRFRVLWIENYYCTRVHYESTSGESFYWQMLLNCVQFFMGILNLQKTFIVLEGLREEYPEETNKSLDLFGNLWFDDPGIIH